MSIIMPRRTMARTRRVGVEQDVAAEHAEMAPEAPRLGMYESVFMTTCASEAMTPHSR